MPPASTAFTTRGPAALRSGPFALGGSGRAVASVGHPGAGRDRQLLAKVVASAMPVKWSTVSSVALVLVCKTRTTR